MTLRGAGRRIHEETDHGARRVGAHDEQYPAPLRAAGGAPEFLYVRGALEREDALAVAVVGSRHATPYGLSVAEGLAADLAARGVCVVSGLARGIDTAAHLGALRGGGRTIAVLGSGVDVIYPPENARLAARIAERGAVISPFEPGTPPLAFHFPARNRVIAGLALGVVVVEAAERSGALLTAEFAAEMGREVMAVPGRVTSAESRGAHRLIQDGAALVQDAGDVIGLLPGPWQACVRPGGDRPAEPGGDGPGPASPEEDRVLEALGEEPVGVDEVIERTGMAPGRAVAALLALELRGQARQLGGKRFVRA